MPEPSVTPGWRPISAAGVAVRATCPRCHQEATHVAMTYDAAGHVLSLTWGHGGARSSPSLQHEHVVGVEELVRLGILTPEPPPTTETPAAPITDEELDALELVARDPLTEAELTEIEGDYRYDEHRDRPDLWAGRAHRLAAEVRRLRALTHPSDVTTYGDTHRRRLCHACGHAVGEPIDTRISATGLDVDF